MITEHQRILAKTLYSQLRAEVGPELSRLVKTDIVSPDGTRWMACERVTADNIQVRVTLELKIYDLKKQQAIT